MTPPISFRISDAEVEFLAAHRLEDESISQCAKRLLFSNLHSILDAKAEIEMMENSFLNGRIRAEFDNIKYYINDLKNEVEILQFDPASKPRPNTSPNTTATDLLKSLRKWMI